MAYGPEQRRMIGLAKQLSAGQPPRVRRALLEAMAVESNFRNVGYGDRDSEGVLQQRPSTGWGPASEPAAVDIRQFLARASAANRGFQGTAGALAQSVQRSAFPGRYDQRRGEVNALLGGDRAGGAPAGPGQARYGPGPSPGGTPDRRAFAAALLGSFHGSDIDTQGLLGALTARREAAAPVPAMPHPSAPAPAAAGQPTGPTGGGLAELFYDPRGSYDSGKFGGPIGGHGDHLHASITNPKLMLWLIQQARRMGLHESENPYVDPVDPVHVKGSFHYRDFPGQYRGHKLGEALDVSGDPKKLDALWNLILQQSGVNRGR